MSRRYPIAIASAFALLLIGTTPSPAWAQTGQNILMIIADDVGVDMIGAYQPYEGSADVPPTPTIDDLAEQGIQFLNTWSNPMCATTRATIQTGRYAYRTGVRHGEQRLPDEEFSIAEILSRDAALDYTTATFGKWGLAHEGDGTHPVWTGYDFFAGDPWSMLDSRDYFGWTKYTAQFDKEASDSACVFSDPAWHRNPACIAYSTPSTSNYATTENVDDTIAWITDPERPGAGQPWFVILSFNAAHEPYHVPPDHLHHFGTVVEGKRKIGPYEAKEKCAGEYESICYRAMIEAMDTEIERLFTTLWPNDDEQGEGELTWLLPTDTTIIFLGDNGSPEGMARDPFRTDDNRAKETLYEGGINIPLIIAGAGVSGTPHVSGALVNTSDLFMTVLELAGVDPSVLPTNLPDNPDDARYNGQVWEHDSFSLMPILSGSTQNIREYACAEAVGYNRTIRNRAGYKLLRVRFNDWEFYDLDTDTDPFEDTNLIVPVDPETGLGTPLIDPNTGKLLARGLLDAEAEAAYFDLSRKLERLETPNLPAANLDSDADTIVNDEDNCAAFANPDQLDTNQDGYGNACDADYDDDDDVDADDFAAFHAAYPSRVGDPNYDPDIDCEGDGGIKLSDYVCFKRLEGLQPGPSGLACAGVVPCIADADADGVRNLDDNCAAFANPDQLDTNWDGYGNACDADYDDDGDVDDDDFAAFQVAFGSREGDPNYDPDIDCEGDGGIKLSDYLCFNRLEDLPPGFFGRVPPGPSGLACAGTAPCVASE